MYGKVFSSLFSGSMYGAGAHVFAVWCFALACKDSDGFIELNPKLLAGVLGEPEEEIARAINYLLLPDEASRTPDEGGRRMTREGQYLYHIVNHKEYTKIQDREALNRYWAEQKRKSKKVKECFESSEKLPDVPTIDIDIDVDVRKEKTTSSSSSRDDTAFVESVKSFWNENNLKPSVRLISDRRRSSILARRRQYGEEEVRTVLNKRRDSSFLSFKFGNGRGADIDWVMGPDNFTKIADGKYDDNESQSQQGTKGMWGIPGRDVERFMNDHGRTPISVEEFTEWNKDVPF